MELTTAPRKVSPEASERLRTIGRHMPRNRYQEGCVQEEGKRPKVWRGHYFVYIKQPDGTERRVHKSQTLGPKSALKKWEAEAKLRDHIAKETGNARPVPSPEVTVEWFWTHRMRPMLEPQWKESSRKNLANAFRYYVLPKFGPMPLGKLDRFTIQTYLNNLAQTHSESAVKKARLWLKALLDEAVDQDYLLKNPADRVELPRMREPDRFTLTVAELSAFMKELEFRDRLIMRIALILGLRPGEIFALRWNDILPDRVIVDEGIVDGKAYDPKSRSSKGAVWLPASLATDLQMWREFCGDVQPNEFVFPSSVGTPIGDDNYRYRIVRPAAKRAGLKRVTFQAMRRTCATTMQTSANVKDIQAHLRHSDPTITAAVYMQIIPESVRRAVDSLDSQLKV